MERCFYHTEELTKFIRWRRNDGNQETDCSQKQNSPVWVYYPPNGTVFPINGGFYVPNNTHYSPKWSYAQNKGFYPLYGADKNNPPKGAYYSPTMVYYPLTWTYVASNKAYFPMNWAYYAANGSYFPPDEATKTLNDLPADTIPKPMSVKLDQSAFIYYIKSLGALQRAWIVVVLLGLLKPPVALRINKEILEVAANLGDSITSVFVNAFNTHSRILFICMHR
jgi:hypothetical protein